MLVESSDVMVLTCTSKIERVVVHARGALVTRVVDVPADLPNGVVDLEVPGITVLAESGTFRAAARQRHIASVKTSLQAPASGAMPGPSVERVNAIAARIARLESHVRVLRARRDRLADLPLDPALAIRTGEGRGQERMAESLAAAELVRRWLEDCDERLLDLAEQLRALGLERDAASLADRQARSVERMGSGHPALCVHLRLEGHGAEPRLRLSYVVMAARWWPVYTLRAEGRADRVQWMIEALVAQLTGEDWSGVELALSTADLLFDARMPELPSLRMGRAQPAKAAGYRPAPAGLDTMFAGYDAGFPAVSGGAAPGFTVTVDGPAVPRDQGKAQQSEAGRIMASGSPLPMPPPAAPSMSMAVPGAPPMPPSPAPVMQASVPRGKARAASEGARLAEQVDVGAAAVAPPPAPPQEIEPADEWLDFDSLRMAGPETRGARGRLRRETDSEAASDRRVAASRVNALEPGVRVRDPAGTRGLFDARYLAQGLAQVPSDAKAHRVHVASAEASAEMRYRTVPREVRDVFRELRVKNPFAFPLLDGPADVYMDGSLAATADLSRQDVGGVARVGLGVEERIRVARNVRVEEETTGLLGGGVAVHHAISIELTSSMGSKASVEVVDRMPDTDDKDVEIKLISSTPVAGRYTQAELGAPIRGGLGWVLELPPGGKAAVDYRYRISFSSKSELVGGNRRD